MGLTIGDDEEPADLVRLERSDVTSTVQMRYEPAEEDVVTCEESARRQDDKEVHGNVNLWGVSEMDRSGRWGGRAELTPVD